MNITIDKQSTIGELNERFQKEFPFLRIDFFKPESTFISFLQERINDNVRLISIDKPEYKSNFQINGECKVKDVENFFRNAFHAEVQVLRRSGTQWLVTTTTDNYTLQKENSIGEEMLTSVAQPEPQDIHEQP